MIDIINDLLAALHHAKDASPEKGATQLLVQKGENLYNFRTVNFIWHRFPEQTERTPTCILESLNDFSGALVNIDDVLAMVDGIKNQSSDHGNTLVVIGDGDYLPDLASVKILNMPHPIAEQGTYPICALVVAIDTDENDENDP